MKWRTRSNSQQWRHQTVWLVLAVALGTGEVLGDAASVPGVRTGRAIQCDGFLMEWREADAQPLGSSSRGKWDAVRTADGIAGYVRMPLTQSCPPQGVQLIDLSRPELVWLALPMAGDSANASLYSVQCDSVAGECVLEFDIPWHRVPVDSAGAFALGMAALDTCGQLLGVATLRGGRASMFSQVFTTKIRLQVAAIATLLVLYFFFYLRVRRKRIPRTQSPRR